MYVEANMTLVPPIVAAERFKEVATSAFNLSIINESNNVNLISKPRSSSNFMLSVFFIVG